MLIFKVLSVVILSSTLIGCLRAGIGVLRREGELRALMHRPLLLAAGALSAGGLIAVLNYPNPTAAALIAHLAFVFIGLTFLLFRPRGPG